MCSSDLPAGCGMRGSVQQAREAAQLGRRGGEQGRAWLWRRCSHGQLAAGERGEHARERRSRSVAAEGQRGRAREGAACGGTRPKAGWRASGVSRVGSSQQTASGARPKARRWAARNRVGGWSTRRPVWQDARSAWWLGSRTLAAVSAARSGGQLATELVHGTTGPGGARRR